MFHGDMRQRKAKERLGLHGAYNGQKEPDDCGGCQGSDGEEGPRSHVITGSTVPPHAAVATATATAGLAAISLSSVGFLASSTEKDQTWKAR
eukprot:scaffold111568_cov57-Phaeocystis_antarctica.AAC.2